MRWWIALYILVSSGCFQARYLAQAARGQTELLLKARAIDRVVDDPAVDPRVRSLLRSVAVIKEFGKRHGLKPTGNYETYVQLRHPAVSWVVSACPPLRFEPVHWSFPVVGTVPYLGFFDPMDAAAYARSLKSDGLDVDVRAVEAYSTLGWFKDPVLSSMIPPGEGTLAELANVILHESTHATVYVPGQGSFNESLASFVADSLTPLFLVEQGASRELAMWNEMETRRTVRLRKLHETYSALDALYNSTLSDDEKRAQKARILAEIRAELRFRREINNATIMQFKTYSATSDGFRVVHSVCGGNTRRFLDLMGRIPSSRFGIDQREELDTLLMLMAHQGC